MLLTVKLRAQGTLKDFKPALFENCAMGAQGIP